MLQELEITITSWEKGGLSQSRNAEVHFTCLNHDVISVMKTKGERLLGRWLTDGLSYEWSLNNRPVKSSVQVVIIIFLFWRGMTVLSLDVSRFVTVGLALVCSIISSSIYSFLQQNIVRYPYFLESGCTWYTSWDKILDHCEFSVGSCEVLVQTTSTQRVTWLHLRDQYLQTSGA